MSDREIISQYEKEVQEEEKYYSHYGEKKQKQVELHRKILSIAKRVLED